MQILLQVSTVPHFCLHVSIQVNTFQAVMITDTERSVVMYNYGKLTWTTGINSGGINGLLGVPALVRVSEVYFFLFPTCDSHK